MSLLCYSYCSQARLQIFLLSPILWSSLSISLIIWKTITNFCALHSLLMLLIHNCDDINGSYSWQWEKIENQKTQYLVIAFRQASCLKQVINSENLQKAWFLRLIIPWNNMQIPQNCRRKRTCQVLTTI